MPKCSNCGNEETVLHYGGALGTNKDKAMCGLCFQIADGNAERAKVTKANAKLAGGSP